MFHVEHKAKPSSSTYVPPACATISRKAQPKVKETFMLALQGSAFRQVRLRSAKTLVESAAILTPTDMAELLVAVEMFCRSVEMVGLNCGPPKSLDQADMVFLDQMVQVWQGCMDRIGRADRASLPVMEEEDLEETLP
jgi:hypothetical protein